MAKQSRSSHAAKPSGLYTRTWLMTQFIARTVSSMGVSGSGRWQNRTSLHTHSHRQQSTSTHQQQASSHQAHYMFWAACRLTNGSSEVINACWSASCILALGVRQVVHPKRHSHIVQLQALEGVACALNDVLAGQSLVIGTVTTPEHFRGNHKVLTLPTKLLHASVALLKSAWL